VELTKEEAYEVVIDDIRNIDPDLMINEEERWDALLNYEVRRFALKTTLFIGVKSAKDGKKRATDKEISVKLLKNGLIGLLETVQGK
jgi:hypothetical protein